MEYHSAIKRVKLGHLEEMWVDVKSVIQSEVSQKEKNKCHIWVHIYGIEKNGTDDLICKTEIET